MKKKIIQIFLIILIIISCIFFYKTYNHKNNILFESKIDNSETEEENNSNTEETLEVDDLKRDDEEKEIINILLLGIDKEEKVSDTMMIISLNQKNNTIKLVSIMRDIYVYQGEGMANKINYAYHYGGIQDTIDTINFVFNLNITKYVKVDFEGLVSIVNDLDGININISDKERKSINAKCSKEQLNNSGDVRLNGEQALAFSRLRWIDSDFQRTERQRKVMKGMYNKIKNLDFIKYPKVIYKLSKASETNLSKKELLELGSYIYNCRDENMSELRIPIDGTTSHSTKGTYHLNWDEEVNKKALNDFIYN